MEIGHSERRDYDSMWNNCFVLVERNVESVHGMNIPDSFHILHRAVV